MITEYQQIALKIPALSVGPVVYAGEVLGAILFTKEGMEKSEGGFEFFINFLSQKGGYAEWRI